MVTGRPGPREELGPSRNNIKTSTVSRVLCARVRAPLFLLYIFRMHTFNTFLISVVNIFIHTTVILSLAGEGKAECGLHALPSAMSPAIGTAVTPGIFVGE